MSAKVEQQVANANAQKLRNEFIANVLAQIKAPVSQINDQLTKDAKLALVAVGYRNTAAFVDDVALAIVHDQLAASPAGDSTSTHDTVAPASPAALAAQVTARLVDECSRCIELILQLVTLHKEAAKAISGIQEISLLFVLANQKKHLANLMPAKLVSSTSLTQLQRLPIYLQANKARTAALLTDQERDRRLEIELNEAILLFENAGGTIPLKPGAPAKIVRARWALEEFRVSLFAQSLGTAEPVSLERIKKLLNS